ncbi:hypothetical protein L1049_021806 [Liquidambar formosana]|uniref:Uncharacterized protein n=1 Tax=Liquidambar formosana TaxID=63359 RepID=A0AAP0RBG2_LIQFO
METPKFQWKQLSPMLSSFWKLEPLELCYRSLCSCGDHSIADGSLLDFLRQVSTFGLSLVRLDIREESDWHTDVIDTITKQREIGSYRGWSEERWQELAFI